VGGLMFTGRVAGGSGASQDRDCGYKVVVEIVNVL
jgi:hypothetical protein